MERVVKKLKESRGGTFFHILIIFIVGMAFLAVIFEFVRVKLVVRNVQSAFERSVRTVAAENYNEVFAGLREGIAEGGQFEGGPEGGVTEEEPEWVELHDTGDMEEELTELLGLEADGGELVNEDSGYTLSGISASVRDSDESESEHYEVDGKLVVKVPFSIAGIAETEVEIPVEVKVIYSERY